VSSALARLSTKLLGGLAGGSAALALTACGAGFQPLTYEERNSSEASEIQIGALEVRDLAVEAPDEFAHEAGETLEVSLVVVNPSGEDDALVEVTTDAASTVELELDGRSVDELEVPAGGALTQGSVSLVDTTRELRAGEYVEMTLRFENNGVETLLVPIRSPQGTPEREHSDKVHSEEEH
jgi:copper(I)-binding protein